MNNILLAIFLGTLFGFSLFYVGATDNSKIKKMLSLKDLNLAKIILSAIGLSSIVVSILNLLNVFNVDHFSIKSMHLGVIIGGIIFGIGFALIGSCPGTLLAGLFINFKKNIIAIIGGLFGAYIFTILYPLLKSFFIFDILKFKISLFNISPKFDSLFYVGFIGLLFFGILLTIIGYYLPKKININKK